MIEERRIKELRKVITEWTDTSVEGLSKRSNLEADIYIAKRKIEFRESKHLYKGGYLGVGESVYSVKI